MGKASARSAVAAQSWAKARTNGGVVAVGDVAGLVDVAQAVADGGAEAGQGAECGAVVCDVPG